MKLQPSSISEMNPNFVQQSIPNYSHNYFPSYPNIPPHYFPFQYLCPQIQTQTSNDLANYNFQKLQDENRDEFFFNQLQNLFQQKNFAEIYTIMENHKFSQKYHQNLQALWFTTRYEEAKATKKSELTPVSKYRIRKKYPLPKTIWDGEETSYCFKEKSRELLKEAFSKSQYPTAIEKRMLAEKTELNKDQICNWFKNRRQRNRNMRLRK